VIIFYSQNVIKPAYMISISMWTKAQHFRYSFQFLESLIYYAV